MTDHERGCQGREYTCTCGYDDERDALIETLVSALKAAQAATEYMGDKLNGMDAVSKEDVEATFDGFNLPRLALEAARQEGFQ